MVKKEPGLPMAISPSFDPSARNSHQLRQWKAMLLKMKTSKAEHRVPVFTDNMKKAKNAYIGSDPAKVNLDQYILKVRFTNQRISHICA